MAGERPERDALAEAIEKVAALPKWDKRTVPGGFHVKRSDVLSILDAARVTLSKSAPDRPEPLPREALDVERLAREAYADRPPLGKRPVPWTPVLRREWTAWARRMAAALSPDRPTPP